MKNKINQVSAFVIGSRLLSCEFFKVVKSNTYIRGIFGNENITENITIATLPYEYEDEFLNFFEELKHEITTSIANAPHRGDLDNVRTALQAMNINFKRTLERISANNSGKIIVKISLENELCAYISLSAAIDYGNSNFTSTPDELMNFLREEIK